MIEIECTARKIGNSIGVTFPKDIVEKANIRENEHIRIILDNSDDVFKKTFGTLKRKSSTDKMMRDIDRDLWGIE